MVTSNNETVYKKYSWMGIEAKGGMLFGETNSGSLVETMRIDTSGNVGMGTTSPDGKLSVSGNIVCNSGTVRSNLGFSSDVDLILNADANDNGSNSIILKKIVQKEHVLRPMEIYY